METITFENLTIQIETTDLLTTYTFTGDISEHFRHEDLPIKASEQVILVLDGIGNFNSIGTREWIHFIAGFAKGTTPVFLENAPLQ